MPTDGYNGDEKAPIDSVMPYIDKPLTDMRVLAADDNEVNRLFLEGILSSKVHQLQVVSDGTEAIAAGEQAHWDMILLDLHMPGADGIDVMQTLVQHNKASEAPHKTLYVVITADARKSEQDRMLELGFHGFLSKPISGEALISGLSAINDHPGEPVTIARSRQAVNTVLDDKSALDVLHQDRKMLTKMRLQFVNELPESLNQVTAALSHPDSSKHRREIWEAVHKMAGGCAYTGAIQLAEICTYIQEQVDHEADLDILLASYLSLRKVVEQTAVAIHSNEKQVA